VTDELQSDCQWLSYIQFIAWLLAILMVLRGLIDKATRIFNCSLSVSDLCHRILTNLERNVSIENDLKPLLWLGYRLKHWEYVVRIPEGMKLPSILRNVHYGSRAQPASCEMGTGVLAWGYLLTPYSPEVKNGCNLLYQEQFKFKKNSFITYN